MKITNLANIKHQTEQNFVDGVVNVVSKQGFDAMKIVRHPKSYGAKAKPYKVSKKSGVSIFKLNLGSCYPHYFDGVDYRSESLIDCTSNIEKFITSTKVKNFLGEA